jgi:hypothetical protein
MQKVSRSKLAVAVGALCNSRRQRSIDTIALGVITGLIIYGPAIQACGNCRVALNA